MNPLMRNKKPHMILRHLSISNVGLVVLTFKVCHRPNLSGFHGYNHHFHYGYFARILFF